MSHVSPTQHESVLPNEVLQALNPALGQTWIDGTLGGGGHTAALAQRVGPTGKVWACDADPRALARCRDRLPSQVELIHANFSELPQWAAAQGWPPVDGILLDLGLSSDQLADDQRGFSFLMAGPLDLRFDDTQGETASELLNQLPERELADVIYRYGEERASRRIAQEIVRQRRLDPEWTSERLADLVARCVPRSKKNPIHPATRTFQALRIAVNRELESLELALREFPNLLKPGGRLGIISFHSLEDRLVKRAFREDPRWQVVTRKPIRPGDEEVARNPRSRSAKFRVAERADPEAEAMSPQIRAPKRNELGR